MFWFIPLSRSEIIHLAARSTTVEFINPTCLCVVSVIREDCIGVIMSGLWLSFSSGWLSCQSDCPNVEQQEISPGGLVLGETWASASPAHCCSLRGYETPLCLVLCYYTYLESLDVLNLEGKELLVGEMFWCNLGIKWLTVWRIEQIWVGL